MSDAPIKPAAKSAFKGAGGSAPRKPVPRPFSVRLSLAERQRLEREAGSRPLGAYIRERLLGADTEQRKISRKPKVDEQSIAQLLAALGRLRLSQNLNQIAKAAHMGALPVTKDLTRELHEACADVKAMRADLIAALGLKEPDRSPFAKARREK